MIIRQQAFIGNKKMLKGGLHCHTTRSDGQGTPEAVIRRYYELGYDFTTLTDHRVYNYENFAPDIPITIIPGTEFNSVNLCADQAYGFRTFHTVCLGPSKEDGNGFEHDERFEPANVKNQYEYQPFLDWIHANNNITFYCHPEWSSTPARMFQNMEGNFAMEIWNSGAVIECNTDKDAAYWDELLGKGKRIFGVAVDDSHNISDQGNGWVMVNAENNIPAILDGLQKGAFYSSCGPEIYDFYVEDGVVHIKCSEVEKICFQCDAHPTKMFKDTMGRLNHAEYSLDVQRWHGGSYPYVRATIIDKAGRYAWTNPIYLDNNEKIEE